MSVFYNYVCGFTTGGILGPVTMNLQLEVSGGVIIAVTGTISNNDGTTGAVYRAPGTVNSPDHLTFNNNIIFPGVNPSYFSVNGFGVADSFDNNYLIYQNDPISDNATGIQAPNPDTVYNSRVIPNTLTIACLLKGTKILLETGYKNIENICVGERVVTHDSRLVEILKIHKSVYPISDLVMPCKIEKGTFGFSTIPFSHLQISLRGEKDNSSISPLTGSVEGGYRNREKVPFENLYLTEGHAIKPYDRFEPPTSYSYKSVPDNIEELHYYHIELKNEIGENRRTNTLIANGLIVESYSTELL